MIEIRSLNAAQLDAFVQSPDFHRLPHLPISVHRGRSHAHNPRAQADDPLLLLAYDSEQPEVMVGYLGVMPDEARFPGGKIMRMAWMSCIWVDSGQRGKGISKLLTRKAYELYEGRIVLTEFTEVAGKLYDRLGLFATLQVNAGRRLYHRLDLHGVLGKKGGKWRKIKPLLKVIDGLGNAVLDLRFLHRRQPKGWVMAPVQEVGPELAEFIASRQGNELFRRGQKELNWMLEWPWVKAGEEDEMARKYEFSSVARFFQNDLVEVRDGQGVLRMFLFFSRRDGNLRLNYCHFEAGLEQEVLAVLRYYLRKWRIKTALVYHPALVKAMSGKRMGALFQKAARREYRIGKEFAAEAQAGGFLIQDGDGDCGFT